MAEYLRLLSLSDAELERFDLVEMNLLVAKSIPALADLDIPRYQRLADEWAEAVQRRLPSAERSFQQTPADWKNDINFFRLGVLCGFLEHEVGIEYREDQREITSIAYTNPSDLFLNGVMDTRRGTCGSMATLHVAIGRRLGWPVSLACAKSHYVCRYDDGRVTHNIEATQSGRGGFASPPDKDLIREFHLPPIAILCGSDLTALSGRQMLGVFAGLRARHIRDCGRPREAELDYLIARHLFPNSRELYVNALGATAPRGAELFERGEVGSPETLGELLIEQYGRRVWPPTIDDATSRAAIQGVIYEPMRK